MNDHQRSELLDLIGSIIADCRKALDALSFQEGNPRRFTIAALMASIYEQAAAIPPLLQESFDSAIPSIARHIIEMGVDLSSLVKDPAFLDSMKQQYINQERTLLNIRKQNPKHVYLSQLYPESKLEAEFLELDAMQKTVAPGTNYSVEQSFKKAGFGEEYDVLYRILSSLTHSTLIGLIDRHVDENDAIAVFKPMDYVIMRMIVDSVSGCLVVGFHSGFEALEIQIPESVLAAQVKLKQFREQS